jgi:Protein of unknown function (DUF2798)
MQYAGPRVCRRAAPTMLPEYLGLSNAERMRAPMKLPHWLAPYINGIFQAGITTALATAIAVHRHQGLGMAFVEGWVPAWLSWVAMLPIVIGISPLIQRFVHAIVEAE